MSSSLRRGIRKHAWARFFVNGAPREIRAPDLLIRSQLEDSDLSVCIHGVLNRCGAHFRMLRMLCIINGLRRVFRSVRHIHVIRFSEFGSSGLPRSFGMPRLPLFSFDQSIRSRFLRLAHSLTPARIPHLVPMGVDLLIGGAQDDSHSRAGLGVGDGCDAFPIPLHTGRHGICHL
jgi:hypothetical protein